MNSLFRRLYHEQEGQVLYLVAALLVGLLGMAALSIDIGFALHGQRELQASADAAATAGAADISNNDNQQGAVQWAKNYDGETGNNNAIKDLYNVAMGSDSSGNPYPQVQCLNYLKNIGMMCANAAGGNAMAVVETATAPTFFGKLFGINQIKLTAKSLSSMKGGSPIPSNISILVDTTPSMSQTDGSGDCTSAVIPGLGHTPTKEDCAKWGVRTLMDQLSPCATGLSSCGAVTSGNVQNAVDEVSLLTFPGLANTASQTADYANCQAQNITQYAYAPASPTSTPPYSTVVPLSSDYRTSDSSALNGGSSPLVKAVDWQDGAGCHSNKYGLEIPVVYDTEFSTAIDQAQAALSALAAPRSGMQSAIILLSDGDATARWCVSGVWCDSGCGAKNSWCLGVPGPNMQMDFTPATPQRFAVNECHQAINEAYNAAQTVNTAGLKTWVYSIAYGSSTSPYSSSNPNGSCITDAAPVGTSPIDGCSTMRQIASDPNKFYADQGKPSDNSSPCKSTAHPSIMNLSEIFTAISEDFHTTQLLPWGTT